MVHINKDYSNLPAKLMDPKWDDIKRNVLTNPNHKPQRECYRESTIDELIKLYANKCACCERSRGEELQVDHYRPKKPRTFSNQNYNHPGYYWLTYEWSNLIPLCSSCNQAKSNYFPLKDNEKRVTNHHHQYAFDPVELNNTEHPLFVNPEIDKKPERHFRYLPNGKIEGNTAEGKEMVDRYKLNNKTKKRERREIIKEYILDIQKAFFRYYQSNENDKLVRLKVSLDTIFEKIIENGSPNKPLSLLHEYFRRYFGDFIKDEFDEKMRKRIAKLFEDYITNYYNN